jgi:hypothetical protein
MVYVELFCQTIYQNGSNFTDRAIYGAEAQKTASLAKLCQTGSKNNALVETSW